MLIERTNLPSPAPPYSHLSPGCATLAASIRERCYGSREVWPPGDAVGVDAGVAVKANLPFKERRGLVLLDPAYEDGKDWQRTGRAISDAVERMANTVVLAWYPLKKEADADGLKADVAALNVPGSLAVELLVREPFAEGGLAGSGLVVVNPPYMLKAELDVLLPLLAERLGVGQWGRGSVKVLTPPR